MLIYRDRQAWLSHLPIRGLMFLAALLWSTVEFRGDEVQKPLNPADRRVGELEHRLPPKDAVPPDDPEASKRIVERAATAMDFQAMAEEMVGHWEPSEKRIPPLEIRMTSADSAPNTERIVASDADQPGEAEQLPPRFNIEARADGVPVIGGLAVSGLEGVSVSFVLKAVGQTGDTEQPVRFEVIPGRLRKVAGDKDSSDDNEPLKSVDIAEDVITIRAIAADEAGPVLATRELSVQVLLEEPSVQKIPVFQHEVKTPEGTLTQRFEYFRLFEKIQADWQIGGFEAKVSWPEQIVLHGKFETFFESGHRQSVEQFYHGKRNGRSEFFYPSGTVERVTDYVNNQKHGEESGYDEAGTRTYGIRHHRGQALEAEQNYSEGFFGKGKTKFSVTSTDATFESGRPRERGELVAYGENGRVLAKGTFLASPNALQNVEWIAGGRPFYKRTGTWEYFYENGNPFMLMTFDESGVQNGESKRWHENGRVSYESVYVNGYLHGEVKSFDKDGRPTQIRHYDNGGKQVGLKSIDTKPPESFRKYGGRPGGMGSDWIKESPDLEGFHSALLR